MGSPSIRNAGSWGEGRESHGKGLGIMTVPKDQGNRRYGPPRAFTEEGCKCVPAPLLPKLPCYFSFSNIKKGSELVSDVWVLNPFPRGFYRCCYALFRKRKWTSDIKCMIRSRKKKKQLFSHLVYLQPQYTEFANLHVTLKVIVFH